MTDPGPPASKHGTGDGSPDVEAALRAGVALFNEGHRLAAHEPWEEAWLEIDGGDDERLFHGLIQFVAATHHAGRRNYSGAVGCGEGAAGYLEGVPSTYRGLDLDPIRAWCRRIATDPEVVERARPPAMTVDDAALTFAELDLEAMLLAAPVLAETIQLPGVEMDRELFETAASLVREERPSGRTRVTELVVAFLREPDTRPQVTARLADHVARERGRRRDVDGLF